MKRVFQKVIAIMLCIATVITLLPAEQLGLQFITARAESAAPVTPTAYEGILAQAELRLEGGGERSSGDWRYVLLEEKHIAVVTGYNGAAAQEITIPDLLEGVDVAGIAANALANLKGVRRIGVPTNVIAIGEDALPVGAAVQANSGVYASKWARKNGHAFTSTSDYDFIEDVVRVSEKSNPVLSNREYRIRPRR